LLATVIAFGYSFYLYRKDSLLEEVKKSVKLLLAVFRFVSVWLIFLLLLGIILENFVDRKEKPLVFVAHDNSESVILTKDSSFYKDSYIGQLKKFSEDLKTDFDIIEYSFSDQITEGIGKEYEGKVTNISDVFDQIFDQYTNRNIGAIVMSTDGLYNTGSNPIYSISRKSFLPVFTIGLGDTNQVRDAKVELVKHNDIAFLGNEFPVEISISQTLCNSEKVKIGVYDEGRLISEQPINFTKENEMATVNFVLKASSLGFRKYTARITEIDNEFSYRNNEANFYIEVIDGRQKILIAHNGPHPDISAIRYVIENNRNYEVDVMAIDDVEGVEAYDLIILHNYQSTNNVISEAVKAGETACLFVVGNTTNIRALSDSKVGFSGSRTDTEEVGFSANTSFKEILLSPKVVQMLSSAPPLQAPFGNFNFSSAIDVLAYQKIGNIQLDKPLIYFTRKNTRKYGVIMGEGLWRWRLNDQLKNNTTANFEEFIGKLITYLAIKDNKDPFKVHVEKEYNESESIVVKAELYNQSYELINEPEVEFAYENEEGKIFKPHFVRSGNAYKLNLGKLEQGVYSWTASTDFQDKHYSKLGTFLVKEVKLELLNTVADHRLLNNIAQNSGGSFYFPNQLNELKTELLQREDLVTVVYQEKSFDDLIDYKWLFIIIFLLMSTEWFFRKYHGAY
jgi:hypothetical protein